MTDQDRPHGDEPAFDDPADAWVRDLLASARDTGPVPEEVAARLDATLASLRAERVGAGDERESGTVVPLRRRLAPLVAAAAAVVLVAGGAVGVTRLARQGSDSSQSSAGSVSADRGAAASPTPGAPADQLSGRAPAAAVSVPRLSRATFAQDAATVMRAFSLDERAGSAGGSSTGNATGSSGTTPGTSPAPTSGDTTATDGAAPPQAEAAQKGAAPPVTATPGSQALVAPVAACPGPLVTGAVVVPATLDGSPVALLFRPPTATAQRVEAWSCDGTTLLAAASVHR